MRLLQVLPLQVSVYQGIMTMKWYSTFPRDPGLEPHHRMVILQREILTPLQSCNWRILLLQPTGLKILSIHTHIHGSVCGPMFYRLIGLMGRVFTNGPGDLGSIYSPSERVRTKNLLYIYIYIYIYIYTY